jgi:UDP-glucose 4-epimerase
VKAVVTGGAGFIGSHLVERLIADGLDVHVIDDFRSGDYVSDGAVTHPMAVANAPWQAWTGASVIYHLASPVGPVGVLSRAGRIASEVIADATVAHAARVAGCPLVYVSTSELYGPQGGACEESLPRVTLPGHSARMEYAVAKLAAETMLLNSGLDVRIIRPFNVAGPRQKAAGGFVLPRFIAQARNHEPLTVYQPGSQLRAFTHVADIVDGLVLAACLGSAGEVWNLGNPENLCSIETLASFVLDALWPDGDYRIVDPVTLWGPAFREAPDKWPDAGKAYRQLGWKAHRTIAQTIEDAACL